MSVIQRSDNDADPGTWPGKQQGLSSRESEVLGLITAGLTNNEIAGKVNLSINSVKSYIRHAYQKMGVETRAQAVAWGYQNGFEPDDFAVWADAGG
jgi:NarL family two-component system response regulator LiaR